MKKIEAIMDNFCTDDAVITETMLTLPKSNVLKFYFADDWLAVRPSGTEPKIKFYFGAKGDDMTSVEQRLDIIERAIRCIV